MKTLLAFLLVIAATWPGSATAAEPDLYKTDAGPHRVREAKMVWHDESRARDIPVKIYAPRDADGALPVVVVSHGLGGSREGLEYLGRHWASHGYLAVHLQHAGSDVRLWQGKPQAEGRRAMQRAAKDPQAALDRPQDVRFAIDQLLAGPLKVRSDSWSIDPTRLAVAGHSFGAFTALASAGINFSPLGVSPTNYGDPRLVASIALSATAFRNQRRGAFDTVRIPTLHMTGTDDRGAVVDTGPEERRNAYDRIRNAPKYLVILEGGDHAVFGGVRRGAAKRTDERHWAIIRSTTTAFLDSIVNGDASATAWLAKQLPNIGAGVALIEQAAPD
jgi:dienelactone hydrolase